MQFDKEKIIGLVYRLEVEVQMPDGTSRYIQYEGKSYETCLTKLREANQQVENLYQMVERPEVVEF